MGCPGCLPGEREKQEQLLQREAEAKAYANAHQKLMVIYSMEDGSIGYMEAEAAKLAGIQPIKFVPYLPAPDNG